MGGYCWVCGNVGWEWLRKESNGREVNGGNGCGGSYF